MRKHKDQKVVKPSVEKVVDVGALSDVSWCEDFALDKYTEMDATRMVGMNDI